VETFTIAPLTVCPSQSNLLSFAAPGTNVVEIAAASPVLRPQRLSTGRPALATAR
jgi:hypothetical protein